MMRLAPLYLLSLCCSRTVHDTHTSVEDPGSATHGATAAEVIGVPILSRVVTGVPVAPVTTREVVPVTTRETISPNSRSLTSSLSEGAEGQLQLVGWRRLTPQERADSLLTGGRLIEEDPGVVGSSRAAAVRGGVVSSSRPPAPANGAAPAPPTVPLEGWSVASALPSARLRAIFGFGPSQIIVASGPAAGARAFANAARPHEAHPTVVSVAGHFPSRSCPLHFVQGRPVGNYDGPEHAQGLRESAWAAVEEAARTPPAATGRVTPPTTPPRVTPPTTPPTTTPDLVPVESSRSRYCSNKYCSKTKLFVGGFCCCTVAAVFGATGFCVVRGVESTTTGSPTTLMQEIFPTGGAKGGRAPTTGGATTPTTTRSQTDIPNTPLGCGATRSSEQSTAVRTQPSNNAPTDPWFRHSCNANHPNSLQHQTNCFKALVETDARYADRGGFFLFAPDEIISYLRTATNGARGGGGSWRWPVEGDLREYCWEWRVVRWGAEKGTKQWIEPTRGWRELP